MDEQGLTSRLRKRPGAPAVLVAASALAMLLASASCSDRTRDPIVLGNDLDDASGPTFIAPSDGGIDANEGGLTQYCPSSRCPDGHVTCPSSHFACDVDLQTDILNCGACGASCPLPTDQEQFECLAGACVLHCSIGPTFLDCDGVADNGCEVAPKTNANCGACGNVCADPAKPCIAVHTDSYQCGCPSGLKLCPADDTSSDNFCVTNDDDNHCGTCATVCDPADPTKPTLPVAYEEHYGCSAGKCGSPKCNDGYLDCDSNPFNGCEIDSLSDANCGGCGKACSPGQTCKLSPFGQPFCGCPSGTTFCGSCIQICSDGTCFDSDTCFGSCVDLTSDVFHCGSCGLSCDTGAPSSIPVCAYGSCESRCPEGRADCNGNTSDGCEVATASDPNNCGGCGITCDAVAGQACVSGRCVVEPCDQIPADGGVAR